MHKIKLCGYKATADVEVLHLGTSGSYGVEQLEVKRLGEWADLAVTMAFYYGAADPVVVVLPASGVVDVPAEATSRPILNGKITFRGIGADKRIYTADIGYTATAHSDVEGESPVPPTPSEVEQIAMLAQKAQLSAAAAKEDAGQAQQSANAAEISAAAAVEQSTAAAESAEQAVLAADRAEARASAAEASSAAAGEQATAAAVSAAAAQARADSAEGYATAAAENASIAAAEAAEAMTVANAAAASAEVAMQSAGTAEVDAREAKADAATAKAEATAAASRADAAYSLADSKQDAIPDLPAIRAGAEKGATALQAVPITYRTAAAQDAIDGALSDRINGLEAAQFPDATPVGFPLISGTTISRFSSEDYFIFPFRVDVRGRPFRMEFKFSTGSDMTTQQNILDSHFGLALAIQSGRGIMALSSNGSSWDIGLVTGTMPIAANAVYYARIEWDGSRYVGSLSTDGQTYTEDMVMASALGPYPQTIYIGGAPDLFGAGTAHPFKGSIDMAAARLYVAGIEVWQGMGTVGLASRADVGLQNLDAQGEARFERLLAKDNPTGTGAVSFNRKAGSTVGQYSFTAGKDCEAGGYGFASGVNCKAGVRSFAGGGGADGGSQATGTGSFAFGVPTRGFDGTMISPIASNTASFAVGAGTAAAGYAAIAMGVGCKCTGGYSVAGGYYSSATGAVSISFGTGVMANGNYQCCFGLYNDNQADSAIEIGGGTSSARANIFRVTKTGGVEAKGDVECNGIVLTSPNGTRYRIEIGDDGQLVTTGSTEEWVFELEDGTTVTKKVMVIE